MKISISYIHGYIFLDEIGQENFNESTYLQKQVEKYYEYISDYTESIHLEKIYPRKGKRKYSQQEGIRMIATEEKNKPELMKSSETQQKENWERERRRYE